LWATRAGAGDGDEVEVGVELGAGVVTTVFLAFVALGVAPGVSVLFDFAVAAAR